ENLVAVPQRRQRPLTRTHGLPIDVHSAGPALAEPAAEMRSTEADIVAQDIEQRRRRIGVHCYLFAVHAEGCHDPSCLVRLEEKVPLYYTLTNSTEFLAPCLGVT